MFLVRVLGSSAAMPLHGRHHSAQWLQYGSLHFLLDCGEATQHQILRYRLPLHKLNGVFISHLHADHVGGIGGLLTTLHMQGHQKPLYLFGPSGLRSFVENQLYGTFSALRYPLYIREVLLRREKVLLWDAPHIEVWGFPLQHGVPTIGYFFVEKPKPRRLDPVQFAETGLPEHILPRLKAEGMIDYEGRRITWESVSLPPLPPKSYAYCTDTIFSPQTADFVLGVTVLYHEATFSAEHKERAIQTFHATAQEAALIAEACRAQRLYIGHFSTRYKDLTPLLQEARRFFPETYLVEEGQTLSFP
ncbi:MAG: ribonuclease Z [Bacteroidia bacterium]|nr:ribonuclease Z [Bacteroidia bacterium]